MIIFQSFKWHWIKITIEKNAFLCFPYALHFHKKKHDWFFQFFSLKPSTNFNQQTKKNVSLKINNILIENFRAFLIEMYQLVTIFWSIGVWHSKGSLIYRVIFKTVLKLKLLILI